MPIGAAPTYTLQTNKELGNVVLRFQPRSSYNQSLATKLAYQYPIMLNNVYQANKIFHSSLHAIQMILTFFFFPLLSTLIVSTQTLHWDFGHAATKEDLIPPVPILTRYKKEVGIKAFVKKELFDPRLPDERRSTEISVRTTPTLCVQLNTLYVSSGLASCFHYEGRKYFCNDFLMLNSTKP